MKYVLNLNFFWANKQEAEYLGYIAGSGSVRTSFSKVTTIKDWPLPEAQKQVKSLLLFVRFLVSIIYHFGVCSASLTDLC